tara:strand:+ start:57 stop:857 length:801 start_codon:yes stop_codon:yes gene_type:complete
MQKKCLILINGLFTNINTSLKECHNNMNEMIVKNNPNYKFEIVINTSYNNILYNDKWKYEKNNYEKEIDKENLENFINKNYSNSTIIYCNNYNEDIINNPFKRLFFRIRNSYDAIKLEELFFDKVILLRPDIIINKKINLDHMSGFNMICNVKSRPCNIHDRDWDLCWISDLQEFKIWYYLNICFYYQYYHFDDKININYEKCLNEQKEFEKKFEEFYNIVNTEANLETSDPLYYQHTHYIIYYMIKKGFKVSTCDNEELFVKILR